MYTEVVQYSSDPAAVSKLVHPDGTAEYRLTKDVVHELDNDGNPVIQGKEVYFEIRAGKTQPSPEEIQEQFDTWWNYGINWPANDPTPTQEERIASLEQDSVIALEGIAELYELIIG